MKTKQRKNAKRAKGKDSVPTCQKCLTPFTRADSLRKHHRLGICKGRPRNTYCTPCVKDFKTQWRLQRHITSKHKTKEETCTPNDSPIPYIPRSEHFKQEEAVTESFSDEEAIVESSSEEDMTEGPIINRRSLHEMLGCS